MCEIGNGLGMGNVMALDQVPEQDCVKIFLMDLDPQVPIKTGNLRKVDFPLRRTPIQTVALPGTVSIRKCRGTPVDKGLSWKSRMSDLITSIIRYAPVKSISS